MYNVNPFLHMTAEDLYRKIRYYFSIPGHTLKRVLPKELSDEHPFSQWLFHTMEQKPGFFDKAYSELEILMGDRLDNRPTWSGILRRIGLVRERLGQDQDAPIAECLKALSLEFIPDIAFQALAAYCIAYKDCGCILLTKIAPRSASPAAKKKLFAQMADYFDFLNVCPFEQMPDGELSQARPFQPWFFNFLGQPIRFRQAWEDAWKEAPEAEENRLRILESASDPKYANGNIRQWLLAMSNWGYCRYGREDFTASILAEYCMDVPEAKDAMLAMMAPVMPLVAKSKAVNPEGYQAIDKLLRQPKDQQFWSFTDDAVPHTWSSYPVRVKLKVSQDASCPNGISLKSSYSPAMKALEKIRDTDMTRQECRDLGFTKEEGYILLLRDCWQDYGWELSSTDTDPNALHTLQALARKRNVRFTTRQCLTKGKLVSPARLSFTAGSIVKELDGWLYNETG